MTKEKVWLVFALLVQVIQGILILLFWKAPVKESVFLPDLLERLLSDTGSLQTEQICTLVISLAAWMVLLVCLAGLNQSYRSRCLPVPVFAGVVFCGVLAFAGIGKWTQTAGEFRLWMLFLKADIVAWILIGLFLAGRILEKKTLPSG